MYKNWFNSFWKNLYFKPSFMFLYCIINVLKQYEDLRVLICFFFIMCCQIKMTYWITKLLFLCVVYGIIYKQRVWAKEKLHFSWAVINDSCLSSEEKKVFWINFIKRISVAIRVKRQWLNIEINRAVISVENSYEILSQMLKI